MSTSEKLKLFANLGVEDEKMKPMHEMNCWECKWGVKGKPEKDGVIPITCSNVTATTFDITESVTLCSDFECEPPPPKRWGRFTSGYNKNTRRADNEQV